MRNVRPSATRSVANAVVALLASWACSDTSSDEGEQVSFKSDIRPLLQQRCVLCHTQGGGLDLDIDPFAPGDGLFVVDNTWFEGHGGLQRNVVPYDPDSSFLMQKITDHELLPSSCDRSASDGACGLDTAGLFMPPRPPPATDAQVAIVRQWILDGARDTPDFRNGVAPIFGTWWRFTAQSCGQAGYAEFCVPCITCHYDDAPTTPNLRVPNLTDKTKTPEEISQEVAAWLQTIVGVKARFRADLDLVTPGDPDASFLVMKLEAKTASSPVGAPMPAGFEPLSAAEVDRIRRWILQGARND
jgi:mono/diheme cytochrome c family protein